MNHWLGARFTPHHFLWEMHNKVAVITLNRPKKKNALTFECYAELRDTFHALTTCKDVKAVVITGANGDFCSGGDVVEIIKPLTEMSIQGLNEFTQMTGDLIKAMRACPQPIIAAIDGICAGAGAAIAMASDIRIGTHRAKTAFLFVRVGLAGCDMGACAILPRIIGHGRASELLLTGRTMSAKEAERWGFFNRLCEGDQLLEEALALAGKLAEGPTFAHKVTKEMLNLEWDMSLDDAIDAEARAQAFCMQTNDFKRACDAFIEKRTPEFKGD